MRSGQQGHSLTGCPPQEPVGVGTARVTYLCTARLERKANTSSPTKMMSSKPPAPPSSPYTKLLEVAHSQVSPLYQCVSVIRHLGGGGRVRGQVAAVAGPTSSSRLLCDAVLALGTPHSLGYKDHGYFPPSQLQPILWWKIQPGLPHLPTHLPKLFLLCRAAPLSSVPWEPLLRETFPDGLLGSPPRDTPILPHLSMVWLVLLSLFCLHRSCYFLSLWGPFLPGGQGGRGVVPGLGVRRAAGSGRDGSSGGGTLTNSGGRCVGAGTSPCCSSGRC